MPCSVLVMPLHGGSEPGSVTAEYLDVLLPLKKRSEFRCDLGVLNEFHHIVWCRLFSIFKEKREVEIERTATGLRSHE